MELLFGSGKLHKKNIDEKSFLFLNILPKELSDTYLYIYDYLVLSSLHRNEA